MSPPSNHDDSVPDPGRINRNGSLSDPVNVKDPSPSTSTCGRIPGEIMAPRGTPKDQMQEHGHSWDFDFDWKILGADLLVHGFCLALYLIPICLLEHPHGTSPTLDEIHIMSLENQDIRGGSGENGKSWYEAFLNDYWGRRMNDPSSHKSWRPLTVLSFRWLKGLYTHQELTTHRVVGVFTHAAVADMVGRLGARVWWRVTSTSSSTSTTTTTSTSASASKSNSASTSSYFRSSRTSPSPSHDSSWLLRTSIKLLFALHPTHVEATANAANRNHILAVMASLLASDPTVPLHWTLVALIAGFLCSETFVFQIPAILVTNVVLRYSDELRTRMKLRHTGSHKTIHIHENSNKKNGNHGDTVDSELGMPQGLGSVIVWYLHCILAVLPRVLLTVLVTLTYLGGRHYFDTLSIPDGLIRPAENPFADFVGEHRTRNYIYVLAVHMAKSWGIVDPIGFSHEYGRDCVSPLEEWDDERLKLPAAIAISLLTATIAILALRPATLSGPLFLHWAWLITLLPISGLFKVGTFISDRIVVASTVSVAIWGGYAVYLWWTRWIHTVPAAPLQALVVGWLVVHAYHRVHLRTMEWMDSTTLIQSSLVTCPRFGKAHMEASKLHSGMYPEIFDLDRSLHHLEMAEESDPDLCDVHLQFAYIAIQQGRYEDYEDRLTQAVLCPFSMGGALPQWQQYWKVTMESAKRQPEEQQEIQRRHDHYASIIQRAVEKEKEKERLAAERN